MRRNPFPTIQSQIDYAKYHYLARIKFKKEVQTMQITKINKNTYHLKVEGAIINVREGLYDSQGRKVTEVSIIPDNHIPDLPIWHLLGHAYNRLVQSKNLKVVR